MNPACLHSPNWSDDDSVPKKQILLLNRREHAGSEQSSIQPESLLATCLTVEFVPAASVQVTKRTSLSANQATTGLKSAYHAHMFPTSL